MSRAPLVMAKPDKAFPRGDQVVYDTTLGWRFPNPRMEEMFPLESMGETGENVAERYGVSREEQDAFALRSQRRWAAAQEAGRFADELVALDGVERDEHPRPETDAEKLAALRPAFREGGTVTAGNSSGINDGAAALVIASEERARELGAEPLGAFVGSAVAGKAAEASKRHRKRRLGGLPPSASVSDRARRLSSSDDARRALPRARAAARAARAGPRRLLLRAGGAEASHRRRAAARARAPRCRRRRAARGARRPLARGAGAGPRDDRADAGGRGAAVCGGGRADVRDSAALDRRARVRARARAARRHAPGLGRPGGPVRSLVRGGCAAGCGARAGRRRGARARTGADARDRGAAGGRAGGARDRDGRALVRV